MRTGREQIQRALESGLQRPFGPGGPQIEMPDATYDVLRRNPEHAPMAIEEAIASEEAIVRTNAYDYLVRLIEVEAARERVVALFRRGLDDDAWPIRQGSRNALLRLGAMNSE